MSSLSPQYLSPGYQSPWKPPLHISLSPTTLSTMWQSELSTVLEWVKKLQLRIWVSYFVVVHRAHRTPSRTVVCPTPSTAAMVTITNTPPVTIGGSMLTFTCSGDNEVRTSTCGSSGWSPDPETFDSSSLITSVLIVLSIILLWLTSLDPQVACGSPAAPSRGSVDIISGTPPFSLGLQVIYRCDEGLFPPDVRTSTCTDVEGRGEWVKNPGSLVCRERPGEMLVGKMFRLPKPHW